jgi:Tfp pilus assembly protein PilV
MDLRKRLLCYAILAAVAAAGMQCSDDDDTAPTDPENSEKNIISFKFPGLTPNVTATINATAKTIAATVPAGTDVTALVPTIEISEDASITPASGAAQNFTNPVTYTVTAEDDSQQTYTVTVTVEEAERVCYPTELPGANYFTNYITYNTDNTVATVTYNKETFSEVRTEYEYTNGKLSRIETFRADVLIEYTLYTYAASTITVTYYPDETDFEAARYVIFYLDGERITGYGDHSVEQGGARQDSAVFTYTNDNITHINFYMDTDEVQFTHDIEYDDKSNPHAQLGLGHWEFDVFYGQSFNKNNFTQLTSNGDYTQVITYTYNEDGLPLTRTIDEGPAENYVYDCR